MATPSRPRRGSYVEAARDRAEATRRLQEVVFNISWISQLSAVVSLMFTHVRLFLPLVERGAPAVNASLHSRRITTTGNESRHCCLSLQEAAAQRPEGMEGVVTADRRARQVRLLVGANPDSSW